MSTIKTTHLQHPSAASPAITLDAAGNLLMPGGKILQIVRATDATNRSTTSTSFADVTGMSVTITPQKSDSAIVIISAFLADIVNNNVTGIFAITDSSNNTISGAEGPFIYTQFGGNIYWPITLMAYATPATTSAVTYKLRFRVSGTQTLTIRNAITTGQMYAIEVSA